MKTRSSSRLIREALTLLTGVLMIGSGGQASQLTVDRDYVLALGTANRFLAAWQQRDADAGMP